jgi:hypothetical protein
MTSYRLASFGILRLGLGVGLLALLVGCQERTHEFIVGNSPVKMDGSVPDATATGSGGMGGMVGSGGAGGTIVGTGGAGTGGSGPCVPAPETCGNVGIDNDCDGDPNDVDPDQLQDLANCGACFNLCNQPNAVNIQCLADATTGEIGCHYNCAAGYVDTDGNKANGCECQIESPTELCNLKVDEGFDTATDPQNCGRCGVKCEYPFAAAVCTAGTCGMGACLAGFFDANKLDSDGCECQKTVGGVEVCDGVDNDCDGMIDEVTDLVGAPPCKTMGVCAGVAPVCNGAMGWSCNYGADYQEAEDMAKGCDGKDNDCDGRVDEAFDIGKACQVGTGPCAGTGVWVCDATTGMRKCNGQMIQPQPEVCDGKDNDCDGKVDELESVANRTTDDKLVYFPGKNVTMFAYEATRYDSTATDAGFDSAQRPCSVPGRKPWASITKEDAAAACAKIGTGWRLCTKDEWFDACNGSGNTTFPYGNTYSQTACVGFDYTTPNPNTAPTATGAATMCVSDLSSAAGDELYDMSGNVKEWVLTTVSPAAYEMRGGAYDIASFLDNSVSPAVRKAPGLQCDASVPAPSVSVRLPSVGFRCCLPGQLPAQ